MGRSDREETLARRPTDGVSLLFVLLCACMHRQRHQSQPITLLLVTSDLTSMLYGHCKCAVIELTLTWMDWSLCARAGIVFLVLLCVLLCCPCFSIAGHGEFYETFPLIRQARDRYMAQKLASLNDQRARKGLPPLPLHNAPAHASGAEQSHTSQKLRF